MTSRDMTEEVKEAEEKVVESSQIKAGLWGVIAKYFVFVYIGCAQGSL